MRKRIGLSKSEAIYYLKKIDNFRDVIYIGYKHLGVFVMLLLMIFVVSFLYYYFQGLPKW